MTDSERFYTSVLDLLEDHDEAREVGDLLAWWNGLVIQAQHNIYSLWYLLFFSQIFPNYSEPSRPLSKESALAKIKAKRAAIKQRAALMSADTNIS